MEDQRTRYSKVKKLLVPLKGKKMHISKIKFEIMINIGSSETVIEECLRLMIDTSLITETDHLMFRIN